MPHLPYPGPEPSSDRIRVESAARAQRGGKLLNLYRMLLHSPVVAEAWLGLGTAIRYRTGISPRQRELSICLISLLNDCEYEWHQHAREAVEAGVGVDELGDLTSWRSSRHFDEKDRTVLHYVEQTTLGHPLHDDEFERLSQLLDETQIVELTALVGYYTGLSRFLIALGVDDSDEES